MALEWNNIKPLHGSQDKAFEELCAQLARVESPDEAEFRRKGVQDAGVECYCILPDGSEWGWQAKYFQTLSATQWSQIDKSVKTALEKHPKLTCYYVCVPMDRSDARITGQQSAMQSWDKRVGKWSSWADERGMSVEFIWWGSSELIERLSRSEHIGRRYFWFGQRGFDEAWFKSRLDESVRSAGARYSPEIHIDLPIAHNLEAFSRSDFFFDQIKSLARGIREQFRFLRSEQRSREEVRKAVSVNCLAGLVEKILVAFSRIEPCPCGELPFAEIAGWTESAKDEVAKIRGALSKHDKAYLSQNKGKDSESAYYRSPFRTGLYHIRRLYRVLDEAQSMLEHSHSIASSRLMILEGSAGMGKTHLLCDYARKRTEAGAPMILLMGQRFLTKNPPWVQAREQLDLSDVGLSAFVGALEAAAQAAGCRALLIIDALNEGKGRWLWPNHLAPFLEALSKSPWIGVLLSVRSEYEKVILPDFPMEAVKVTHVGFAGHEYDATQAIFAHYGLEFPSTPILQPEFSHPLLLIAVCEGLTGRKEKRLPRGFHGITAVFDLYLDAINNRLARSLDYNPNDPLVRLALTRLVVFQSQNDEPWLDRHKAESMVNELLPGRTFQESLYQGLVTEGVLTVAMDWRQEDSSTEVVHMSYERFADYLMAESLLDVHLDMESPQAAFEKGGQLSFICDSDGYVASGLLEALCVLVPERVGQEFLTLAPTVREHPGIAGAFLQSIIWRRPDACLTETKEFLESLIQDDHYRYNTLDPLLTVATIDGHPLNAIFLDERLRQDSMPDRDVWWSTSLHYAWSEQGPVHRLVDWASSIDGGRTPSESTVDLCSIVLAWMFSTPNRFLRDRATKALVSLLTGRLDAAERLVERLADADDLYVAERVFAVAYGVAMRSHDSIGVGRLARLVHDSVFASGSPRVHILLRDYARGVVERAIQLDAELDVDVHLVRPPYKSTWPSIPDKSEYETLRSDIYGESDEENTKDIAKQAIVFSIGNEFSDFSRYVIGEDIEWLSIPLNEQPWESPNARLNSLLSTFSESERAAYREWIEASERVPINLEVVFVSPDGTEEEEDFSTIDSTNSDLEKQQLEQDCERAFEKLINVLGNV